MGVFSYSITMKLLLLVVAAAGVAQGAVTCDECQAAAQDFVSHLLTEESIAEQVQLMKDNVCPQLGMDGCEGILDMWYADMATCIFNHFIIEGECFCGAEGHTEDCPSLVDAVVPLAMPVLAAALTEKTVEHCQEIVGVC